MSTSDYQLVMLFQLIILLKESNDFIFFTTNSLYFLHTDPCGPAIFYKRQINYVCFMIDFLFLSINRYT